MALKSERLKKLENEFKDLDHWLQLGLVPKKDIAKHKEEMQQLKEKIDEEKRRLKTLKESGEIEEYVPPKRGGRPVYQEPQTLPEMEVAEEGGTEAGIDMETSTFTAETATGEEVEEGEEGAREEEEEDEEDPFSDRSRWRRGIIEDPESNEW